MNPDMKFLVVDDFATMRRIIKSVLNELGYSNVIEADDGDVARDLEAARTRGFGDADHGDVVDREYRRRRLDTVEQVERRFAREPGVERARLDDQLGEVRDPDRLERLAVAL